MFVALSAVAPLFLLILVGAAIRRTAFMAGGGTAGLTGFVFHVAVPALLFRTTVGGIDIGPADVGFVAAYYAGTLLMFGLGAGVARFALAAPTGEQGLFGLSCAYGNTVLLGIPLIGTLYGAPGLAAITLIISLQALLLLPLANFIVGMDRSRPTGEGPAVAAVRAAVLNPIVLAVAAGFAVSGLGVPVPGFVARTVDMLAVAATPCALVALGAKLFGRAEARAGTAAPTALVVGIKLAVHPVAVWLSAVLVFGVTAELVAIAVLTAALPVGANAYVLAQARDIVPERTANAVAISTAISVVSLTVLAAVLR